MSDVCMKVRGNYVEYLKMLQELAPNMEKDFSNDEKLAFQAGALMMFEGLTALIAGDDTEACALFKIYAHTAEQTFIEKFKEV